MSVEKMLLIDMPYEGSTDPAEDKADGRSFAADALCAADCEEDCDEDCPCYYAGYDEGYESGQDRILEQVESAIDYEGIALTLVVTAIIALPLYFLAFGRNRSY